ncbi:phospholipase D-like domain-containing protein [Sphingomonas parva]|uniref:phospholipase D-like domain-containing protein n=1 Tax=Sphingomonas parva TaxID=2555898 RepID=UPI001CDD36F3|nr:phospholipase D-like domain-containing protein [Sphingomonas parva]
MADATFPGPPLPIEGRDIWRRTHARRAALIVDAEDYYCCAFEALLEARSQIILIGWDVDTRVWLTDRKHAGKAPVALGPLLLWLARRRPELSIYILAWDEGLISVPGRGTTLFRLLRWAVQPRVSIKWDSTHPLDASHHQKILVIDDALGFCGGIDITADRWDTRRHCDNEPLRKRPFTRRAYEPWHDATMAVDGDAASALGDLARLRWRIATGEDLPRPASAGDPWPKRLEPTFRDVPAALARTRGKDGEIGEVREVEALFLNLIRAARRSVYIETQYFASRVVAEAIAARLEEKDGPEFVIVNPRTAEGWLDEAVMGPARAELVRALHARDRHHRFRIYTPVTEGGADIYVHAKIMIVDDIFLRVGSANLNNRSMGLDSECDLLIDGRDDARVQATIRDVRTDLLAEHLGMAPDSFAAAHAEAGSLIGAIERLRGEGRTLCPFTPPDPGAVKTALARGEVLDPEAADELFERRARPGLLARLGGRRRR